MKCKTILSRRARVYDGITMPFPAASFDLCVSNYVLEHVADPASHFQEVFRVLKPDRLLFPHSESLALRNDDREPDAAFSAFARGEQTARARSEAHDPWPTLYRANTRSKLRHWARAPACCLRNSG